MVTGEIYKTNDPDKARELIETGKVRYAFDTRVGWPQDVLEEFSPCLLIPVGVAYWLVIEEHLEPHDLASYNVLG